MLPEGRAYTCSHRFVRLSVRMSVYPSICVSEYPETTIRICIRVLCYIRPKYYVLLYVYTNTYMFKLMEGLLINCHILVSAHREDLSNIFC